MTGRFLVLAAEVASHADRVEREAGEVERLAGAAAADPTARWAAAAHLQAFYTGIEAILIRIAEAFEGSAPGGPDSHLEPLRRASLDVPSLRPPVLSPESIASLQPYLAFRHFFRHAYGVELDREKVAAKVGRVRETWTRVARDIEAFRAFLTGLSGR